MNKEEKKRLHKTLGIAMMPSNPALGTLLFLEFWKPFGDE